MSKVIRRLFMSQSDDKSVYGKGNFAKYILIQIVSVSVCLGVELVEASVHAFHANPDITFPEEGTIKCYSISTVSCSHRDIQVCQ